MLSFISPTRPIYQYIMSQNLLSSTSVIVVVTVNPDSTRETSEKKLYSLAIPTDVGGGSHGFNRVPFRYNINNKCLEYRPLFVLIYNDKHLKHRPLFVLI